VPVWFGGHHERTLPRIAKWGDGWMPNAYPPDQEALDIFGQLRSLTEEAGRDPTQVGIEVWVSMGTGTEADWAKETRFWKQAGASHICLTTTFNRRHHKRIPGHTMGDQLAAIRRYHRAVADQPATSCAKTELNCGPVKWRPSPRDGPAVGDRRARPCNRA
jgi:alkanesulfonate monooxygenase SsuD/methylene tetrahydromethanopterin reductase-like flavin-dependent oxidoreductase (luciferase family)